MLLLYPNRQHTLTADQHAMYRQQSDFLYHTHIAAPGYRAILTGKQLYIFKPEINEKIRRREGECYSADTLTMLNPSAIYLPVSKRDDIVKQLYEVDLQIITNLSYLNYDTIEDRQGLCLLLSCDENDCIDINQSYRAIKMPQELLALRKAQKLTLDAIDFAIQDIKPGMSEYEISARLSYYYAVRGYSDAFPPIVAAGANACILHYTHNNKRIKEGDLLLIDTGAYCDGYCGDCSRTIIVGDNTGEKTFKQLYLSLVQQVHDDCIAYVRPGKTLQDIHHYAVKQFCFYFKKNNLTRKDEYFPHSIGHSIGLDVHDPLEKNRPLENGMVITIEPGLYLPEYGIGIRRENVVVLSVDYAEILV